MSGCTLPAIFNLFGACAQPSPQASVEYEIADIDNSFDHGNGNKTDEAAEPVKCLSVKSELSDASTTDSLSEKGSIDYEICSDLEGLALVSNGISSIDVMEDDHQSAQCRCGPAQCDLLHSALQEGRLIEAHSNATQDLQERLKHVIERYEESLRASQTGWQKKKGWVSEHRDGLDLAFHVDGNQVSMMAKIDFDDCDPLHALAALREVDLCSAYKTNVSSALPLVEDDGIDSLWMLKLTGQFSGKKEESIVEVIAADVLDEPIKALWVSMADPTVRPLPDSLPPVENGITRVRDGCSSFLIVPRAGTGGFQLSIAGKAKIPAAAAKMPSFVVKMIVRRDMQEFSNRFRHHIKENRTLQHRIDNSPRAAFYSAIQRRLQDLKTG